MISIDPSPQIVKKPAKLRSGVVPPPQSKRNNKKGGTAAQLYGKTTGRWTDEEHERFLEGNVMRPNFISNQTFR